MEHYVGLDVSLKLTAICIVDRIGRIVREGLVASDPGLIAAFVRSHAPHVAKVGLETGATSTWLWTELNKIWAARHLHRCPTCEGGSEDAD
jgi:transposase